MLELRHVGSESLPLIYTFLLTEMQFLLLIGFLHFTFGFQCVGLLILLHVSNSASLSSF